MGGGKPPPTFQNTPKASVSRSGLSPYHLSPNNFAIVCPGG